MDTVGPLAVDVAGLVAGMALLEPGFAVSPPAAMSIGRFRLAADPAVDEALDAALSAAEVGVTDVELPGWHTAERATAVLLAGEAWREYGHLLSTDPAGIGAGVAGLLRTGGTYTPADLAAVQAARAAWQAALDAAAPLSRWVVSAGSGRGA